MGENVERPRLRSRRWGRRATEGGSRGMNPPLIDRPVLPFGSFNSHPSEQAPAGELLFGHDSPASWLVASRNASVFRGCPLPSSAGLWSPTQRPTTLGSPPSPARGPSTSVRPARPSPARRPSTAPRPARVRRWTQEPSHFRLPPASGIAAIGPKLWFIPRLVVHPGPDQARPCGLRRSSSPGGPDRRANRCDEYLERRKTPGQGVFSSSQGYPLTLSQIPRGFLFIHL